jgi:hypothetical protein
MCTVLPLADCSTCSQGAVSQSVAGVFFGEDVQEKNIKTKQKRRNRMVETGWIWTRGIPPIFRAMRLGRAVSRAQFQGKNAFGTNSWPFVAKI